MTLAASLVLSNIVAAEELTWEDCVQEARMNNPALRRARHRLKAAKARRNAAFGGFLPRVTTSAVGSDSDTEKRLYFQRIRRPHYSLGLKVSQSLFSGFSTVADYRRASASARSESSRLRQEEADLRQRLRREFINVMFGQENVKVQEDIAKRRASNADLVQLRYEAGREHIGTAMRSQADAKEAAFEVSRARRALTLAQQRLAREIGRDEFAPLTVQQNWTVTPPPTSPSLEVLAEQTPAMAQARARVEIAKAQLTGAASSFWPSLSASADVSRSGRGAISDMDRSWSADARISYTLFRGGQRWFDHQVARAGVQESQESLTVAWRNTRIALQSTLFTYTDAYEAQAVRKQFLEAARQRAVIGQARYANGLLGFVQWDIIEGELVQAERRFIQARRDVLNGEAEWARIRGEGFSVKP